MNEEQNHGLQVRYGELLRYLRETIGEGDPRSYENAVERLEESMYWASRGVSNVNNQQQ